MYALIALGYTMVYGVLEFINFAHSEIFVLGAFVGVEVLLLLQSAGLLATLHPGVILLLVIVTGMAISGLAAMTLERIAYRPLMGGPRLVALISAIGASFFLQDGLRLFESLWRNTFYLNYPSLEFLDHNLPITRVAGHTGEIAAGDRHGDLDAARAALLRQPHARGHGDSRRCPRSGYGIAHGRAGQSCDRADVLRRRCVGRLGRVCCSAFITAWSIPIPVLFPA